MRPAARALLAVVALLMVAGLASSPFPDHDAELARARALQRAGHPAAAVSALRALVRAEPENALYWEALARAAARGAPVLAREARTRVRQLNPRAR
ncbi:MAG: Tetratricopeptide repeat [Solirubrobacteraceae bacterium]|jgi:predicted Zn-dependent protease|nr:Tetratricopeptide repeat [Solirubrobacteraceae bacterium]